MGSPSSSFGTIAGLSGDSHIIWLFRGSCGLTPRRRCQPSSDATRAEPVFPTKREGPARRCSRHAVVVEALMPPDAARVAIRIATRVATVYTNAPKRHREAISTDLCTLLRVPTVTRTILARRNSVHKCPETARRGPILPFVYTPASPRSLERSSRCNRVHECPETAPRGHFHRSVYTPASSPWR